MNTRKDWFKPKKYPHIGLPLHYNERHRVESYVRNPEKIAHHAFLPLIKRTQLHHRYKIIDGKKRRKSKERDICYASHLDSQIFSFYGGLLQKRYEKYIREHGYADCVIAYRSLPRENSKGNKCNIDLAKDAFDCIAGKALVSDQAIIISDITGFFDNLDHHILKQAWKEITGIDSLPDDEYNIFKHVTRYSYVEYQALFKLFSCGLLCETKTGIRERKVNNHRFVREKNIIAFCDKNNISKIRRRGLIKSHPDKTGIPQGLPVSATLANMYMWQFDQNMNSYLSRIGGYYRRYSDDIIIVCGLKNLAEVKDKLKQEIKEVKLCISPDKTTVLYAHQDADTRIIHILDETGGISKIEYLGLSFDGSAIRLKDKSISKYYLKMKRSVGAKYHYARNINNKTRGHLFVPQLLRKYTPLGSIKHPIWVRDKRDKSKFVNTHRKSFGNYWTYVKKAAIICKSDAIIRQLRHNKPILKNRIVKAKEWLQRHTKQSAQ